MDPDLTLQPHDTTQIVGHAGRRIAWERLAPRARQVEQPLIRPAPRSVMVLPLVILVAVLPGMAALNAWDLTPPGPLWGLRGLAVFDGLVLDQMPAATEIKPISESAAFRALAFQPPLYAWLEALGFWLSTNCDPLASVLPSYMAGALVVVLVYLHGRLWGGAGLGLTAAVLVGLSQSLLLRMQEATPTTLVVCGILAALLAYGWRERSGTDSTDSWSRASAVLWAMAGGLALGLALLSVGGVAFIVIPIILLHRLYLGATLPQVLSKSSSSRWQRSSQVCAGLSDGLIALAISLALALPWFALMVKSHGWQALASLLTPPDGVSGDSQSGLLLRLIKLAPMTLPLGLLGAVRAIRLALVAEADSPETLSGSLWVIWLSVAALVPAVWRNGPSSTFDLILLVPLSLLAAQSLTDLANRRLSIRTLIVVAPATAMSVGWWASADLSKAIDDLIHGRASTATALGLHLVLDLVIASVLMIRALYRWARRRDDRQRWILAVFILTVLSATVVTGLREVLFRHSETHALLSLRTMVLRRNRAGPFRVVAVVTPSSLGLHRAPRRRTVEQPLPGGRLRFILRTALPRLPQLDLNSIDGLFSLPEGQRLVVLVGAAQRLSSADQAKLDFEIIHPGRSGILDVYATAQHRPVRR